ncbi:MAG: hypothetical protein H7Y86_04330, partial [Rhizobacter sp.]|nr:hypothetical protein [Ferruginibacter sp.]
MNVELVATSSRYAVAPLALFQLAWNDVAVILVAALAVGIEGAVQQAEVVVLIEPELLV